MAPPDTYVITITGTVLSTTAVATFSVTFCVIEHLTLANVPDTVTYHVGQGLLATEPMVATQHFQCGHDMKFKFTASQDGKELGTPGFI